MELQNGNDSLQIESDHIEFEDNITIEKVNIRNQTDDDIHKQTSASTTLITEATNGEKRKEKDKVEVSKIIHHHRNVEKSNLETTQHDVPIVPPQNQDESVIREVPAISTKPMSSAADGEERKEKENIEASKLICHYNDNIPENIRNDPKNDTSIICNQIEQPTIEKDATTESTTSSIP